MLIPNYFPITADQYAELVSADEDTAVDLAMEWMEDEINGPGADIDKAADELAAALSDVDARRAVIGVRLLCEDPALYVASVDQTAGLARALAGATVDEDAEADLETLTALYTTAVENGHATAILYN